MISRYRDNYGFFADGRRKLAFDKVRHFACTLADQSDDNDIGINALQYLAHQNRLADARACDNRDPLALAYGEQRVDRSDARIHRPDNASPVERIAVCTGNFLPPATCGHRATIKRPAACVNHTAKQFIADVDPVILAIGINGRAIGDASDIAQRLNDCALTLKAYKLAFGKLASLCLDARARAQRIGKTADFAILPV